MRKPEDLKSAVETGLGGLEATPGMKYRILEQAEAGRGTRGYRSWIPAVCVAAAVMILLAAVFIPAQHGGTPLIVNQPAGETTDVPVAGKSVSAGTLKKGGGSKAQSLWASGGSPFPVIGVDGRYYRMLVSPANASSSLAGESLGTVSQYTDEPTLAGTSGIISNIAGEETEVYAVSGMGGTLILADIGGQTRIFQRITFNGSTVLGQEGLADVLQLTGHVSSMTLSGTGTVTGSAAQDLADTLLSKARYVSASNVKADQTLQITLDNGVIVQALVNGERLSACGTWSCPEFFEAFAAAVE